MSDDDFEIGAAAPPTPRNPPNRYDGLSESDAEFALGGAFAAADDDPEPALVPSDDEDFAMGGDAAVPVAKRRRRTRLPRTLQTVGVLCVFLLADHRVPTPSVMMHTFARAPDFEPHYEGILAVVGVAILGYAMRRAGTDAPTDHLSALATSAKRKRRGLAGGSLGFLDFFVNAIYRYDQPFEIFEDEFADPFAAIGWRNDLKHVEFVDGSTMEELEARHSVKSPTSYMCVSPSHAEVLVKEQSSAVKVVAVSEKTRRCQVPQCGPPFKDVQKWARQLKLEERQRSDGGPSTARSALLDLPSGVAENPQSGRKSAKNADQHDAVEFLRWLRFSRHLHAQEAILEAADDGLDASVADIDSLKSQIDAARTRVPKKSSLKQGRCHLDATTMLLRRRWFNELITERPNDVLAFFLYTDGSPVSGTELQGMLLDYISRSKEVMTLVLPGVALAYGAYGVLSKAFALLWALFLVIGPWAFGITFVLDRIRGTTTDMGNELGLPDVPNLVAGFLKHITGVSLAEIRGTIDLSTRLFKRCLRLDGWSHRFGNLMN
jgi:hypothetical protein